MLKRFPDDDPAIFIADRGYESYNVLAHLIQAKKRFVFRVKAPDSNKILRGLDLPAGIPFDLTLDFSLAAHASKRLKSSPKPYRKSLIEDQGREINRLQKMLEGANIKLSGTIKDINGMSGRCLIEKIVNGEKIDEKVYDELYESKAIARNLKASKEQIIADLNGVLSDLQRRMMKELIAHLDELEKHIKNLDEEIDNFMKPDEKTASKLIQDIPGIGNTSAQAIISVIGTDMSRFPTDRHISKWAGLCPGNNESAGKRKSGKTAKGNKVLRTTLITCAHAAVKVKNSFFNAQFARISAHRGTKRAYVAGAHSMLIAIYHVLSTGELFKDLGSDYYNQFNKERKANSMVKRLKALGYEVTIATVAATA